MQTTLIRTQETPPNKLLLFSIFLSVPLIFKSSIRTSRVLTHVAHVVPLVYRSVGTVGTNARLDVNGFLELHSWMGRPEVLFVAHTRRGEVANGTHRVLHFHLLDGRFTLSVACSRAVTRCRVRSMLADVVNDPHAISCRGRAWFYLGRDKRIRNEANISHMARFQENETYEKSGYFKTIDNGI